MENNFNFVFYGLVMVMVIVIYFVIFIKKNTTGIPSKKNTVYNYEGTPLLRPAKKKKEYSNA